MNGIIDFFSDGNKRTSEHLFLFPNALSRKYWTAELAKTYNGIPLDNFVTVSHIKSMLQKYISADTEYPVRILTKLEQRYIMLLVLRQQASQQYLSKLEQITTLETDISLSYANKIIYILHQYVVALAGAHNNELQEYHNIVDKLLQAYVSYLDAHHCIDDIVLLAKLNSYKQHNKSIANPLHINILYPSLLNPLDMLWIQSLGTAHHSDTSSHTQEGVLFYYTLLEGISNSDVGATPILYEYASFDKELEHSMSCISKLIHQEHVPAHEIMLTVCEQDTSTSIALQQLANKYQVPIQLGYNHKHVIAKILQYINSLQHTNYSPASLIDFFLEPSLVWKQRALHITFIKDKMDKECINDTQLHRWKYILQGDRNEVLLTYFNSLETAITHIVHAKSFRELYHHFEHFFKMFLESPVQDIGKYEIEESPHISNHILKEIEPYIVLEAYLMRTGSQQHTKGSVWKVFFEAMGSHDKSVANISASSRDCVQIGGLLASLGVGYKHWFVCNLSQAALVNSCSVRSVFNDYLAEKYGNNILQELYIKYLDSVHTHISHYPSVSLSGSVVGSSGMHILPAYWQRKTRDNVQEQNIWLQEQQHWHDTIATIDDSNKEHSMQYAISPAQHKGISYIILLLVCTTQKQV